MEIVERVGDDPVFSRTFKPAKTLEEVIRRPQRRRWRVFKLLGSVPRSHQDPSVLEREVSSFLGSFFERRSLRTVAKVHHKSVWMELSVLTMAHAKNKEHIFLVHPPHSCYLFITPIRCKEVIPIFHQALCHAFDCPQICELQLSGNDVATLKNLALQKLSQGAFSSYRLCASAFDSNPLETHTLAAKRRRAVIDKIIAEEKLQEQEARLEGKERNKVVDKSGKRAPQHRFTSGLRASDDDNITALCIRSTGDLELPENAGTLKRFNCFVRIEGSDVLQGLESLYENDLVVPGQEIPKELDINDIVLNQTRVQKRRKGTPSKQPPNQILWMKTA